MAGIHHGVVTWFNVDKGYGFIRPESGDDVVVRASALGGAARTLHEGQHVTFELAHGDLAPQANNVMVLHS